MKKIHSPNYDNRDKNIALEYIVLHYTGMKDEESAVERLCNPISRVSSHYVIGENGGIMQLVEEAHRAWHAGESSWHGIKDMNSASIGIELVNPGHEFGYHAFPNCQINALKNLINDIIHRHHMPAETALLAHSDIAPSRKQDPGELFPWQTLAQNGLGIWPAPALQDYSPFEEKEAAQLLDFIGYNITRFEPALLAFQRRFCPQSMGIGSDKETAARLRAIRRRLSA
ncbi:MAG: N-acetylmuramoyl-L-alanine amidase [Bdellovibrionales bacterium]